MASIEALTMDLVVRLREWALDPMYALISRQLNEAADKLELPDQSDSTEDNQCSCEKLSVAMAEIERLHDREDAHHLEMAKMLGELAALRAERDAWALKVSQMRGAASNCLAMKPTSGNMRHALERLAGDEAAPPDSASERTP